MTTQVRSHPKRSNSSLAIAKASRGFTVLEMMVALFILLVLYGLFSSVTQRLGSKAKQVGCITNLRQLHTALIAYAGDHNGYFPKAHEIYEDPDKSGQWRKILWKGGYITSYDEKTKTPTKFIVYCPGSKIKPDSYGYYSPGTGNYAINRSIVGYFHWDQNKDEHYPLGQIKQPSSKLLIFDCGTGYTTHLVVTNPNSSGPNYIPGLRGNRDRVSSWAQKYVTDAVEGRHGRTINAVMVDGHVETFTPEAFLDLSKDVWEP